MTADFAAVARRVLGPSAALVMVLVSISLLIAQGDVYRQTTSTDGTANRGMTLGTVIAFCAWRVLTSPERRHPVAAGLALLTGLVLVLDGCTDRETTTGILQVVDGALTVVAAVSALFVRVPKDVEFGVAPRDDAAAAGYWPACDSAISSPARSTRPTS